jgi:hypothetical protein
METTFSTNLISRCSPLLLLLLLLLPLLGLEKANMHLLGWYGREMKLN